MSRLVSASTNAATFYHFVSEPNAPGTAYVVIIPQGDPIPLPAQVKNGQDASGTPVLAGWSDNKSILSNVEIQLDVINLTDGTYYTACFIVEDSLGRIQTTVETLEFRTKEEGDRIPDYIDERTNYNRQMLAIRSIQSPYTFAQVINLTSGDVTFFGKIICELRCKTAGTILIDMPEVFNVNLYSDDYDKFNVRVKKIKKVGTDSGLWADTITVFGFIDEE